MLSKQSTTLFLLIFFLISSSYSQKPISKNPYKDYIDRYKEIAVKKMHEYGIPASITLAQGLLESGSGRSDLAIQANNHFGIKCHKEWTGMTYTMDDDEKGECFRKYASAEESFNDHSLFLTSRRWYIPLFSLDIHDYKGWAYGLKSAGYATNPRYAEMLIKIIEENELYLFDNSIKENELIVDVKSSPVNNIEKTEVSKAEHHDNKSNPNEVKKLNLEFVEITNGNRTIYVNNNVRLTIAREGDDPRKIANDLGISAYQILKYNELGKDETIKPGSFIYVEPKKKKAQKEFHVIVPGESMRDVSQLYGIKLKELRKRNQFSANQEPAPGTKLFLKSNRP